MSDSELHIHIKGARENNLKDLSVSIPHYKLIAITGVSGSGKSSLAFELIAKEGRRRYLESIPSFARQYAGKLSRPDVDEINGLFPVITVGQHKSQLSVQTTLGTLSDLYDHFRLLFARFGHTEEELKLSRSLFSFNRSLGACPVCNGLGTEESISKTKLIEDPNKSLREGALVPSLPNGYIMYSQLTIDAMNMLCNAHDFDVDIPWKDLTEAQQNVIWYGSERIKVPFGKHSIESRLKWTGMKAKPREEAHYRGMIPVMADILKRDRNKNILRFVDALPCSACQGKRLNKQALSVEYRGHNIADYATMSLWDLEAVLKKNLAKGKAEEKIVERLLGILERLCHLGLGHYSMSYPAKELSGGEIQRIRLVNQLSAGLSEVLYVFDEPSAGLHAGDRKYLLDLFAKLVSDGNTVLLVEHDPMMIRQTDWVLELGPGAGFQGGELCYNGPTIDFLNAVGAGLSPTQLALQQKLLANPNPKEGQDMKLSIAGFSEQLHIKMAALNVICGRADAGVGLLLKKGAEALGTKTIWVDRSPIGRTPRSNPATYTGLADHIRDLYAKQEKAKELSYTKSRFSFNNKGGRCETCQGAGKTQLGMHYMGQVELLCTVCNGKRFNTDTLAVTYRDKNIAEVYEMRISEALLFFSEEKKILNYLKQLQLLGLSYLSLGQSSTTLSGGEAQRIKLATALLKKRNEALCFVIEEPTSGLHYQDSLLLIAALRTINNAGHTILCSEHQAQFIVAADWVVEASKGKLFQGKPAAFLDSDSPTATLLQASYSLPSRRPSKSGEAIRIEGCTTHRLKEVNPVFPKYKTTVITGLSGSGKSSLAFYSLFAEAQSRFSVSMSSYMRSFIKQANVASATAFENLSPTVAIERKSFSQNKRSTVGTLSGLNEKYRFLFSRLAQREGAALRASDFSFNNEYGACKTCSGIASLSKALPDLLVQNDQLSIKEGVFLWHKRLAYYGNPDGQYVALLSKAAEALDLDIDMPLKDLSKEAFDLVFYGSGTRVWETRWTFKNKTRSGEKDISGEWKGFCALIEEEYTLKHKGKETGAFAALMADVLCSDCQGSRLKKELLVYRLKGKHIADLCDMSVLDTLTFFESIPKGSLEAKLIYGFYDVVQTMLRRMIALGLGHLSLSRSTKTLSGGEGQRLRLAAQFSRRLSGLIYVLDEPTIGLHPDNVRQLLAVVDELKQAGNTIVIVEHDKEVILSADHIIEMGPGSGVYGGQIVVQGAPEKILSSKESLTAPYLLSDRLPKKEIYPITERAFGVKGVNKYSISKRDFIFNGGGLIAITGVSGAGKSTLMQTVLEPSLRLKKPMACDAVFGTEYFDRVVLFDQKDLQHTAKMTLAQHTGILEHLQSFFAATDQAKSLGYKKRHFSHLYKEGRCEHCKGEGHLQQQMDFMSDVWNECGLCNGQRYQQEILKVRLSGKHIADCLSMTIDELCLFLASVDTKNKHKLEAILELLSELALGHLEVGQTLKSLSGGEAQRVKLSTHLAATSKANKQLFLLDEPSSGLHYKDLDVLIALFHKLAKAGHTIMYVEHNPYMIAVANQEICL